MVDCGLLVVPVYKKKNTDSSKGDSKRVVVVYGLWVVDCGLLLGIVPVCKKKETYSRKGRCKRAFVGG